MTDSEDIVDSEPVGGNEDIQLQALLELVSAGVDYYLLSLVLPHVYTLPCGAKFLRAINFTDFVFFLLIHEIFSTK